METLKDLSNLKRRELQALCKTHGIKANMKNLEMIKALESLTRKKDSLGNESDSVIHADHEKENTAYEAMHVSPTNRSSSVCTESQQATVTLAATPTPDLNMEQSEILNDKDTADINEVIKSPQSLATSNHKCILEEAIAVPAISSYSVTEGKSQLSPPHVVEGSDDLSSIQNDTTTDDVSMRVSVGSPPPTIWNNDYHTSPIDEEEATSPPDIAQSSKNAYSRNSTGTCSPKLNTTFTIESPEKEISEASDPYTALNESLTRTPSALKQLGASPLCGSWLNRDTVPARKDSNSTKNRSLGCNTCETNLKNTTTMEDIKISNHHDEIMALLDTRVNTIMKDPNYVPVDEVSTVSKSKLAVKKGSVTDKFNKLHAKQFQKMESITDSARKGRKRPLECTTSTNNSGLTAVKKPKVQKVASTKLLKPATKISGSSINRLATPKHYSVNKKPPNTSRTTPFK